MLKVRYLNKSYNFSGVNSSEVDELHSFRMASDFNPTSASRVASVFI